MPKVLIIKIGSPVVSSEEIDGETWTVQTHEFALFSQVAGSVTIPEFQIRYGSRQGFTGPVENHVEQVPSLNVQIKAPSGYQSGQFVVTTDSFDVQEAWKPATKNAKEGDVFKRTITQTAGQVSGMALPPPPQKVPEGIRVYTKPPAVSDRTEWGEFSGQRVDTFTYVFQQPGKMTLPAIQDVWWNPEKESFDSKTLPSVTIDVAQVSQPATASESAEQQSFAIYWIIGIIISASFVIWQRRKITQGLVHLRDTINPPHKIAARRFRRACRDNEVDAAERAWFEWMQFQPSTYRPSSSLQDALNDLHSHTYGTSTSVWDGASLDNAFRDEISTEQKRSRVSKHSLLPLNPSSET